MTNRIARALPLTDEQAAQVEEARVALQLVLKAKTPEERRLLMLALADGYLAEIK